MRAVLRVDPPLLHDALEQLLTHSGIEVVASSVDFLTLLLDISRHRPEVVFLAASDATDPPAACSVLLEEFPELKIVMVSSDNYSIADIGLRVLHGSELSVESIHASLLKLMATDRMD